VSPATAVAWQVDVHPGFIPAFISCIKYAPIHDGFDRWRLIGQRCEMKRAVEHASRAFDHDAAAVADKHAPPVSPSTSSSFGSGVDDGHDASGLDEGKVLVLLGLRDVIIMADETSENVVAALGKENVEIVKIHGGHDLVLSNTENCVRAMAEFWESSSNA
jgi:pimeloyl-ACP methyl ester carboxylesterase